jgi:hypothetical protein
LKLVGPLLSNIFKELGIEERFKLSLLQQEWGKIFDKPLSLHTYPYELSKGELTINVDSNIWLSQLKFFSTDIIKKLNGFGVDSVRFRFGRVYKKNSTKMNNTKPSHRKHLLSERDREWIEDIISTLEDKELKDNIKKAIEVSLSRKI